MSEKKVDFLTEKGYFSACTAGQCAVCFIIEMKLYIFGTFKYSRFQKFLVYYQITAEHTFQHKEIIDRPKQRFRENIRKRVIDYGI